MWLQAEHFESRAIPAEKKVSELDSKARDLSAEATGVEADLSHQREVNEQKEAAIAEYQEELRNAVTRANRMGAALRTEEEKVAAVKAEAEEERKILEERTIAAEAEAEELRKKSAEDSAHARVLAERIGALEEMITATKDHSMETERKMEAKVKEEADEVRSQEEERNIAQTQANEMKTETGGLLSTIADLKSRMFGVSTKADEKDAEAKAKAEEAETVKSEASKLESSVKSEQETKGNLESELEGVKEKASEADNASAELKQKESKLGEMDQGLQSSGQRLTDLGEKLSTLRRERDEAVASADSNATR